MRKAFGQNPIQNGAILALGLVLVGAGAFAMYKGISAPEVKIFSLFPIVGLLAISIGIGAAVWVFSGMERSKRRLEGEPTGFFHLSSVRFFGFAIGLIVCVALSTGLHDEKNTRMFIAGIISYLAIFPLAIFTIYYLFDWVAQNNYKG